MSVNKITPCKNIPLFHISIFCHLHSADKHHSLKAASLLFTHIFHIEMVSFISLCHSSAVCRLLTYPRWWRLAEWSSMMQANHWLQFISYHVTVSFNHYHGSPFLIMFKDRTFKVQNTVNIAFPADGYVENSFDKGDDGASTAYSGVCVWVIMVNPRLVFCDDWIQRVFYFIMVPPL